MTGAALHKSGKWKRNTGSTDPYYLAFQILLTEAVENADDDATVHFRFDRQNVVEAHAVKTFHETVERQAHPLYARLGSIAYVDSEMEVGLQAADLHSYAWYSFATKGSQIRQEVRQVLNVLSVGRKSMGVWREDMTEQLLSRLSPKQREQLESKTS